MLRIVHFSSNVLFCIATVGFLLSLPSLNTMVSSVFATNDDVIVGVFKNDASRDLGVDNSDKLFDLLRANDRETVEKFVGESKVSYVLRVGTSESMTDDSLFGVYSVYVDKGRIDLVEDAPEDTLRHWITLDGKDMETFKRLIKNPETKLINMSFL